MSEVRARYTCRRDSAVFHPSFSTTTQSNPSSFSSFWNAARESTLSEVHEVQAGLRRSLVLSRSWSLTATGDVSPARLARLTTRLPDKYPGQDIVFQSKGLSVASTAVAAWTRHALSLELAAAYYHTWNYRSAAQFHRDVLGGSVGFRVSP